jgi:hypothetical protein
MLRLSQVWWGVEGYLSGRLLVAEKLLVCFGGQWAAGTVDGQLK